MRDQKLHNELMETHKDNIGQVSNKLKKISGNPKIAIDSIETLIGTFNDKNVLEGFRANTEKLCGPRDDNNEFCNDFYKACLEDNMVIFDLTAKEEMNIPKMTMKDLDEIIFKRLKANKSGDVYHVTLNHFRYTGQDTLNHILTFLNIIINNINFVFCPEIKTSLGTIIYKGKNKPIDHHKSYRQDRVSPYLGRILDEFIRPITEPITRQLQNPSQYGFTREMSYLLGAVQRHECEAFANDTKKNCFGCSLDGESAFEVVDRDIQKRELYLAGERGDVWRFSHHSYENTFTKIKMDNKLSLPLEEHLGVKQGHIKSSDHYLAYNRPLLDTLDSASLGFRIGPICVNSSDVADDVYILSESQEGLQQALEIASHYGCRHRVNFRASKTKITISGPEIDRKYYQDTKP